MRQADLHLRRGNDAQRAAAIAAAARPVERDRVDRTDVPFVTLDPAERLRRLEAREIERRAGEPHDDRAWREFRAWASGYDDPAFDGRSRASHEAWLASLAQPVLRLDSARSREELRDEVLGWVERLG